MDTIQLILTICFYIISFVLALLLAMTSRKLRDDSIRLPFATHLLLAFLTIVFSFTFPGQSISEYLLLFTVCSGVALSLWALRNRYLSLPVKVYLGAYLLTILLFFWSPSLLFYSISGNFGLYRPEQQFNLSSNYYLVEQQSMIRNENLPVLYKVIQKFGIYNKTIARDLDFGNVLSAAKLVTMNPDTLIIEGRYANQQRARIGTKPGMKSNQISRKPSKQSIQ